MTTLRNLLIPLLKVAVSATVIFFLVRHIVTDENFDELTEQAVRWPRMGLAALVAIAAVWLQFIRWFVMVKALDLPFELSDAFRLGNLGYLLNLVLIGSVGGDLVKAGLMAAEQPGRRTEAITTVLADRLVGMYSLILIAAVAITLTGVEDQVRGATVLTLIRAALWAAAAGTLLVLLVSIPAFSGPTMTRLAGAVPLLGVVLQSLFAAARAYRDKSKVLALALLISLASNSLFTLALFTLAEALPGNHPSLAEHFVLAPLATSSGLIPLPLGALGAFEAIMNHLYAALLTAPQTLADKGLYVALCYRLVTLAVAVVGASYYVTSRREVASAIRAARAEQAR